MITAASTASTQAAAKELRQLMEARHLATPPEAGVITQRIRLLLESMAVETKRWRDTRGGAEAGAKEVARAVWKGIESGDYVYPSRVESVDGAPCVCLRLMDVIRYLRRSPSLVRLRADCPVAFGRSASLGRELARAGYLVMAPGGKAAQEVERTIRQRREGHLVILRCEPVEAGQTNAPAILD